MEIFLTLRDLFSQWQQRRQVQSTLTEAADAVGLQSLVSAGEMEGECEEHEGEGNVVDVAVELQVWRVSFYAGISYERGES